MKRIILATLCVIFSVGLFAQKALIIHKKDGTILEVPFKAISSFGFKGKAVVNDNDYTSISNFRLYSGVNIDMTFTVNNHFDDPYITTDSGYGEIWGVVYSTTPNVTVETGTILEQNIQRKGSEDRPSWDILFGESQTFAGVRNQYRVDLEYETTYHIRSFVYNSKYNKYFYSKELSVNTGKPSMAYYGVTADPAQFAETGYVMPTDSAWASFAERFPYFKFKNTVSDSIYNAWNNYLTPERIASLKSQCNTVYECCEGMLYMLDNIDDEFGNYALDFYDDEITLAGYTENTSLANCDATSPTHVTCDATWNIPNNEYWEYRGYSLSSKQAVEIPFSKPLMANYYYKVEVTFAPDVTQADTLPTKSNISFYGLNESGRNARLMVNRNYLTNPYSATVATMDSVVAGGFGEGYVEIQQGALIRETQYSRVLRISQIKVIPIGPAKKDEE